MWGLSCPCHGDHVFGDRDECFIPWDDAKIKANGGPLIGLERVRASLNKGKLGVMSARPLKAIVFGLADYSKTKLN